MFRRASLTRRKWHSIPQVHHLEPRCLLTAGDLTTVAQVTAINGAARIVLPVQNSYALNAASVQVDLAARDPDHPGSTPVIHYRVTDQTTGATSAGTGSMLSLSAQGVYRVSYWSTDSDDSEVANAHSIVIGLDRSLPPVFISTVSPNRLWPPNGKFVTVTVNGVASDSLTGINPSSLSFHVKDEYGLVQPSGPITNIVVSNPTSFGGDGLVRFTFQVELQARRHGYDFDGRQYTIMVSAADEAGNTESATANVIVPHDMGRHNHRGAFRGSSGVSAGQPNSGTGLPVKIGRRGGRGHASGGSGQHHGHHGDKSTANNPVVTTPPGLPGQGRDGEGDLPGNPGHGKNKGNGSGNGHGHGHKGS